MPIADQQAHLERLYGVVTDLFIDKHKLRGVNAKNKVPPILMDSNWLEWKWASQVGELMAVLDNYSLEALLAFFQSNAA